MTKIEKQKLFIKILRKAENRGKYVDHVHYLPIFPHNIKGNYRQRKHKAEEIMRVIFWGVRHEIMFSHKFAKAFFGEKDYWKETECTCGGALTLGTDLHYKNCKKLKAKRGYLFHLKELAVLPEGKRLEYLKKHLK